MADSTIKQKAVKSVFWKIGEQGSTQICSFVVGIILARLIAPDQFGIIAMLAVFTGISGVIIDAGFSTALMRKNDRTQIDCSTVFWFNVVISITCYIILFGCSPIIANFYGIPQLSIILKITALNIIIGAFVGVQNTLLTAEMNFKVLTKYNVFSAIISGIAGIIFAYLDFKVWALVIQGLVSNLIKSICIWHKATWRPTFEFSYKSFHEFFGYGSKLLVSRLIDSIYTNIYPIIIGKVYKASDLAFYSRSSSITQMTSSTPTSILQSVTFPTLCKLQDNDEALKNGYRRTLCLSAFVIFPICLGVGAVAYPLITVLFTDIWIYSATLLSIMVFSMMWYPIHAINLNYLMVKGYSNLFLKLEIIKKIQGIIILCITIPFGLEAMCYGGVVGSLLSLVWNTYYTGKFLNMSIFKQLKDLFPILLLSCVMYICSRSLATFMGNNIYSLISSVTLGFVIYFGGALLFRFPEIKELKNLKK